MANNLELLVNRLETVITRLENVAVRSGRGGGAGGNENMEFVEAYEREFLNGKIQTYLDISQKIGGEVADQAVLVKACLVAEKKLLVSAAKHKTPKPEVFQQVIKPLAASVEGVVSLAEKKRGSKYINHLFTVKEGIGSLGWVTVAPKPAPYVKEHFDQALFYGNRVLKEYKGKQDLHVEWMRAYTGAIRELEEYVKTFQSTGLVWNPEGTELTQVASASKPPKGVPAPPPPPAIVAPSKETPSSSDGMPGGLLAALNKGSSVTQGLKKVTDDMKTHKNPELRQSSVVKSLDVKAKPMSSHSKLRTATLAKKPPKIAFQNNKWMVEHYEDNQQLEVTPKESKEFVYVYKCTKCTLKVNGKFNGITIDGCKRVAVVFDDVISSVEVINSQSVQVQTLGKCPTVSIDKTDGCQVYLSNDSVSTQIITAKSSEMNVLIPDGKGEFTEHAIPEQFKTCWDGKYLVTDSTDING